MKVDHKNKMFQIMIKILVCNGYYENGDFVSVENKTKLI